MQLYSCWTGWAILLTASRRCPNTLEAFGMLMESATTALWTRGCASTWPLFTWAEFVAEEPVKPKGRGRKPHPASTSLFDWALSLEQEREEELVGAGR